MPRGGRDDHRRLVPRCTWVVGKNTLMVRDLRLLMVAHCFPPSGRVGALRVTKFVKYLSRLGWRIRVLAGPVSSCKCLNPDWLTEVGAADVIHLPQVPRIFPAVNEEGFYWLPTLLPGLLYHIERFQPSILFFTGDPFYHWPAASLAKRLTGVNYVLDFRDPWATGGYRRRNRKLFTRFAELLDRCYEPQAIAGASLILHVTDHAADLYQRRYPRSAWKIVTLPNGFDPEDLTDLDPIRFSRFDIVYSGKFAGFRDPGPFLEGLKKLIAARRLSPDDVRFVWTGQPEQYVVDAIRRLGLGQYSELVGFKPYREGLRYIKGAALALLVTGWQAYEPTTKVFDYMALGKPILALLGSEGFLSELLGEYGLGRTCLTPTAEQVYSALESLIDHPEECRDREVSEIAPRFDRSKQAETLDRLLRELI